MGLGSHTRSKQVQFCIQRTVIVHPCDKHCLHPCLAPHGLGATLQHISHCNARRRPPPTPKRLNFPIKCAPSTTRPGCRWILADRHHAVSVAAPADRQLVQVADRRSPALLCVATSSSEMACLIEDDAWSRKREAKRLCASFAPLCHFNVSRPPWLCD